MREYNWMLWGKDGLETVRFIGFELGGCLVTKKDDIRQNSIHIEVYQTEDDALYVVRVKNFLNEDQTTTVYKYADLREAAAAACRFVKEAADAGFGVVVENIYIEHPAL